MLKLGSSGRSTAARRSLALLIVGLFGVACSSASISGETDTETDLPADQAGGSEAETSTSMEGPSDGDDLDDEAVGEDQSGTRGFTLDGEPIVVVSENVVNLI